MALVGSSGSGKSSLLRLLFRLYDSSEGRIKINGVDSSQYTLASLRQNMAFIPQETGSLYFSFIKFFVHVIFFVVLFNDTIRYNIGYGKKDATDAEIEEVRTRFYWISSVFRFLFTFYSLLFLLL